MRLNLKPSIQIGDTMNKSILLIPFFLLLLNNVSLAQITVESESLFYQQKQLFDKLGVFKAWEVTKGNTETVIGCIDNGFDFYHPYLYSQLIPGYYVDKSYHPMTFSTMAHGTLVSSLIVAKPKTEKGMHGLAPDCKVLTASIGSIEHLLRHQQKIMKKDPKMSIMDVMKEINKDSIAVQQFVNRWNDYNGTAIAKSIHYLASNGVKVINISAEIVGIYPPQTQQKIDEALSYACERDVLIVIAAGNGNKEIPNTVKKRNNIIMVGALNGNDTPWKMTVGGVTQGSNFGELLDVCVPTEGLVVCLPSDSRFFKSDDGPMGAEDVPYHGDLCNVMPFGATSSAAPIVTSLAALVYSIAPTMSAGEVKKVIIQGCDDIGEKGFDIYTGYGRVNFSKTISHVLNRDIK